MRIQIAENLVNEWDTRAFWILPVLDLGQYKGSQRTFWGLVSVIIQSFQISDAPALNWGKSCDYVKNTILAGEEAVFLVFVFRDWDKGITFHDQWQPENW